MKKSNSLPDSNFAGNYIYLIMNSVLNKENLDGKIKTKTSNLALTKINQICIIPDGMVTFFILLTINIIYIKSKSLESYKE